MVPHLLPIVSHFVWIVISVPGFVLQTHPFSLLLRKIFALDQQHPKYTWSLQNVLFEYLPRFLRRIFSVTWSSSPEWKSAAVMIEPEVCAFLKLNCNTYNMHSTVLAELPSLGKNVLQVCCLWGQLLALLLPTKCVRFREVPCILPKILLSK